MDKANLALFTTSLIVAVASPGPAVAAIVSFVLSNGVKGAFAFIAGIIFSECFWLLASLFGVEAILSQYPQVLLILRFAGVAFLCHMAYQMWQSAGLAFEAGSIKNETAMKLFVGGAVLCITNPKTMVFYLSVLPSLISGQNLGLNGYIVYTLVMLTVTSSIFAAYALLANQARAFLQDANSVKRVKQANAILLFVIAMIILNLTLKAL